MIDFKEEEMDVYLSDTEDEVQFGLFTGGALHVMQRSADEVMRKACVRVARKYDKKGNKGKKGVLDVRVEDKNKDIIVDTTKLTNREWKTGMVVVIGESRRLNVVVNAPVVTSLSVFPKRHIKLGSPIAPNAETKYCEGVKYFWYRKQCDEDEDGYSLVWEGSVYFPASNGKPCKLKLFAVPWRQEEGWIREGRAVSLYLSGKVEKPCDDIPRVIECRSSFLLRDAVSNEATEKGVLRVVSYNILANAFATSPHALRHLYRYVRNKEEHLSEEYRSQLVARELLAYSAGVICLQECDIPIFERYLLPVFAGEGYSGHHTCKRGLGVEGCAMLWSTSLFRCLRCEDIVLSEVLANDPSLELLYQARPEARDVLVNKVGTIAQIVVLQSEVNPEDILVVGNTHLFYHPAAGYVRLLQMRAVLHSMARIRDEVLDLSSVSASASPLLSDPLPVHSRATLTVRMVVAGDLNSPPSAAVIDFLRRGHISPSHTEWQSIEKFSWERSSHDGSCGARLPLSKEKEDIFCREVLPTLPTAFTHPLGLVSAAGCPTYTNYTADFKASLDYIFVENDKFEIVDVAPIPSEEVLSEEVALPSRHFPSDHVSLVVDIRIK